MPIKTTNPHRPTAGPKGGVEDHLEAILAGRILPSMTFDEQVYAMTVRIPAGSVTTYGSIAAALGSPRAARAVGNALNRNPHAPTVPCHRVVGHDRSLTGFAHGLAAKRTLLVDEHVPFEGDRVAASALVHP